MWEFDINTALLMVSHAIQLISEGHPRHKILDSGYSWEIMIMAAHKNVYIAFTPLL